MKIALLEGPKERKVWRKECSNLFVGDQIGDEDGEEQGGDKPVKEDTGNT